MDDNDVGLDNPQLPDECPGCDGEGCLLCEDDPGARADWQWEMCRGGRE